MKNVVYIGTLAQGKRTIVSHKVKKEIQVPECDWVVIENAHEPIISKMDFDAVQILMTRDTKAIVGQSESYMYAGILYCGDCGSSMVRRKESYKGEDYITYICSNYNRNSKDACSRHGIREDELDEIISKEQFARYRDKFTTKEWELEQAVRQQEEIIRNIYENGIIVKKDLEKFKEGLVLGKIDRMMLVSFADRILIYDDFRVEIVFKYRQEMEKAAGLFDMANEEFMEPDYTMIDGLSVLELTEAV